MSTETALRKVIFVALDGGDADLLDEWSNDGSLPHLRAFTERCARVTPSAVPPFSNGVFWPSFFTATNPAKHGRYFRTQVAAGSYGWMRFDDDVDYARQPLWKFASDAGRKVAVLDMPNAPLVAELNGIQLVDWIVHDRCGVPRSWPAGFASAVETRFGSDPNRGSTDSDGSGVRSIEQIRTLASQLVRRIETKRRLVAELVAQNDWDLFMVGFQEAHDIGHVAWHVSEPAHPLHVPGTHTLDPVRQVYVALDEALGELLERAGDTATFVVLAGLGMTPLCTGNYLLDGVLRQFEKGASRSRVDILRDVYHLLPKRIRDKLKRTAANTERAALSEDRRQRRFYAVPHNQNAGAVRINLKGREPDGKVAPGREYDELCAELSAKLEQLINVDTGGPIVAEVVKTADRYSGDSLDRLPDLFVLWDRSAPIHAIAGAGIKETPRKNQAKRTGDHAYKTIALIRGPGIEARHVEMPVSAMDFGATLADWLGVTIPDADGTSFAPALKVRSRA